MFLLQKNNLLRKRCESKTLRLSSLDEKFSESFAPNKTFAKLFVDNTFCQKIILPKMFFCTFSDTTNIYFSAALF